MLLALQPGIIYGPVRSRRLGRSLGVNVLPAQRKVCSFDCLYCQYGRAAPKNTAEARENEFPGVKEILDALEQALKKLPVPPAYITFSGNGEATLHPGFRELVQGVRQLRDSLASEAKTAILSNSTTVNDPDIREALAMLDLRIMKLDAGTEKMFAHYNRPGKGITLEQTAAGLAALGDVTIQSLFTGGPDGNFNPHLLSAWVKQVRRIAPIFVQVYSLDRNSPTRSLVPLDKDDLLHIQSLLHRVDIPTQIY
jgi:wyosine [tRNA(Phe)-imidazoG37] synthetase (radical SAM superfamily)